MKFGVVLQRAAELVLGASCPGCGVPGLGACATCRAVVNSRVPFEVVGVHPGLPVIAAGAYADQLRRLLLAAKERNALGLVPLLGSRLAASAAAAVLEFDVREPVMLVPVPSAPSVVAQRGIDLTQSLAQVAATRLRTAGLDVRAARRLRQVRRPRDQSGLSRADRLANLTEAFRFTGRVPVGSLLIVDDIVTTGATLVEAARACTVAGAEPAAAVTVAATERRGGVR